MSHSKWIVLVLFSATVVFAQNADVHAAAELSAPTTLPIIFTKTISAARSHPGEIFQARTSQIVRLANGMAIPAGADVTGHVTAAVPFTNDKTPYAKQKQSILEFHFDSIEVSGRSIPLDVSMRAMASAIASWDSREPVSTDMDPDSTVTQIGGDLLTPSRHEVVNESGDVVAYNKRGGVYAHLIANGRCDASDVEVSVDIYSASACGLYGFTNISEREAGSAKTLSTIELVSSRTSPTIWKHSTALLEVLPTNQTIAAR